MIVRLSASLVAVLFAFLLPTHAGGGDPSPPRLTDTAHAQSQALLAQPPMADPSGEISILTYNVAGLPAGISASAPERNIPLIGPLLEGFDLVLLQEDFWYHDDLVARVKHFFRSDPASDVPALTSLGDGLNRLSRLPFRGFVRESWSRCHGTLDCGSDCIASKGFSYARTWLPGEVPVDVYNVHLDAARCQGDIEARLEQVGQLVRAIRERSEDVAVVVAGDFNLRETRAQDRQPLAMLREEAGLADSCDALACGERHHVDRVLLRGSDRVALTPRSWEIPDGFLTPDGEPLSDHPPIAVRVAWERR